MCIQIMNYRQNLQTELISQSGHTVHKKIDATVIKI